jgi:7-cyano-7-deazaguanine synthase in queuosine biosynthesis
MPDSPEPVAVLLGGGVESTALVKQFLVAGRAVSPIHVRCGLIWDDCEAAYARRFCEAHADSRLSPLVEISLPLREILADHWAVTGVNIPRAGAPSAELEIPLRNLTLLSFALHAVRRNTRRGAWQSAGWAAPAIAADAQAWACDIGHTPPHGRFNLALGTTADNNYRDGSREYFDRCEQVLSAEADCPVRILTPFIEQSKLDVIRGSDHETLSLSFSCVNPQQMLHCGQCIKCGRRQTAFRDAGVVDPTQYAT